jgi:DNA-binding SARP family transcriptional activator
VTRGGVPGSGDWEVRCLGSFHLRCAGREVPACKSRRGQSLLKYLLASPGFAASTGVLVACLWPQVAALAGARNLQVAVHALRCSLRGCGPGGSDETILFRHNRYLLNPALSIIQDVDAFRAAYERGLCAAKAGSSAEVKRTYLTCLRCLRRDLHLAPATETTLLYKQLTQQSTLSGAH